MVLRSGLMTRTGRTVTLAMTAVFLLGAAEPVLAGSAKDHGKKADAGITVGQATDFSAAKRRYVRRGNRAAGAAVAGAALGIIGTVGAIAAEQARRDAYENSYRYYGPRPYYYGQPYYGPGYAPGYYRYYPY